MCKIVLFFKRMFKKPDQPMPDGVTNALLSFKIAQEKDLKEKHRKHTLCEAKRINRNGSYCP